MMPKTIVFSLDYDGCTDILFDQLLDIKQNGRYKQQMLPVRQMLIDFLNSKVQAGDNVEVYIGSNRQCHLLDQLNAQQGNGSCFENLQALCVKNQWKFNPLLYADTMNKVPAGSAIKDRKLRCDFDAPKIDTIENQLRDIAQNHPEGVDFYFLDDDHRKIILPGLTAYFENPVNLQKIPNNFSLNFIKFDWYAAVFEDKQTLEVISSMQGTKKPGNIEEHLAEAVAMSVFPFTDIDQISISSSHYPDDEIEEISDNTSALQQDDIEPLSTQGSSLALFGMFTTSKANAHEKTNAACGSSSECINTSTINP